MPLEESSRLSRIKAKLERRARILDGIRAFFCREGFIEIETPLRVPAIAPEQFITPLYLRRLVSLHLSRAADEAAALRRI